MTPRDIRSLSRRDGDRILPIRQPAAEEPKETASTGQRHSKVTQESVTKQLCKNGCLPASKFGNCPRCGRKLA